MNKFRTASAVCGCILCHLSMPLATADSKPIDFMNITGGSVVWRTVVGGPLEEDVFTGFGPDTNLVGVYIGSGGSTTLPFEPPDPNNIVFFFLSGGINSVVTYTAPSNLGSTAFPADVITGGPVPTGTLDDTLNSIEIDLSSWFGNLNNATDIWAGTGLDDGFTSPVATGTWNPVTFEYQLSWNSKTPDEIGPYNPFPGLTSTWTLIGHAYPLTAPSISIDIKPGSSTNPINVRSRGKIPVAILTTDEFDATTVDVETVQFAGASPLRWAMEDVDGDTDWDIVLHFKTQETDITCGDTEASLTGNTFDGVDIAGTDSVKTVGCKKK